MGLPIHHPASVNSGETQAQTPALSSITIHNDGSVSRSRQLQPPGPFDRLHLLQTLLNDTHARGSTLLQNGIMLVCAPYGLHIAYLVLDHSNLPGEPLESAAQRFVSRLTRRPVPDNEQATGQDDCSDVPTTVYTPTPQEEEPVGDTYQDPPIYQTLRDLQTSLGEEGDTRAGEHWKFPRDEHPVRRLGTLCINLTP